MSYFPYYGQNGALSNKSIGRDKELVYALHKISRYQLLEL